MKKIYLISICLVLFLVSCSPDIVLVGRLNMVSNRNVNVGSEKYVLLKAYQGASKHEIRKSRHKSIEAAIDDVVKQVSGGEFLTNVKIYYVNGQYWVVEGDVWGK